MKVLYASSYNLISLVAVLVTFIDASISLGLEITVLALLVTAFSFKSRRKYRQHGITMTVAVALHIITILYVMIPSFSMFFTYPGTIVIDIPVIITLIHVAMGLTAFTLGAWLVASWHFKTDLQKCFANKKLMKPTLALWVTAILLGIIMYIIFWTSLLLS